MYRGTIQRAEWGARAPKSVSPMRAPVGLSVVHWEGPALWGPLWPFAHDTCAAKVRGIQAFHMSGIYSDVAYNDLVCPHGYVFAGRGIGVANGANGGNAGANSHRYAVCAVVGDGDPILSMPDLFDALNVALTGYVLFGGAPASPASGHRDVNATACPGNDLDAWADRWAFGATSPTPGPAPAPTPAPTPGPIDWLALRRYLAGVYQSEIVAGPLLRQGSRGGEVTSWQHALNIATGANLTPDGAFGPLTRNATARFQAAARIGVDGIVGPQSRRAMTARLEAIKQGG